MFVDRRQEVRSRSDADLQAETARTWIDRALACYAEFVETREDRWLDDARSCLNPRHAADGAPPRSAPRQAAPDGARRRIVTGDAALVHRPPHGQTPVARSGRVSAIFIERRRDIARTSARQNRKGTPPEASKQAGFRPLKPETHAQSGAALIAAKRQFRHFFGSRQGLSAIRPSSMQITQALCFPRE